MCLLLLLALACCRPAALETAKPPDVDASVFQAGDLILRCGNGFYSGFFRDCSQREKLYSHAGVLVQAAEGDSIRVLHVEMADDPRQSDIHLQSVPAFLAGASAWAVYRLASDEKTRRAVAARALDFRRRGPRFDLDFDASDTTALYCTELVMHCVNDALRHPLIRANTMVQGKKVVAADDIYLHEGIKLISKNTDSK